MKRKLRRRKKEKSKYRETQSNYSNNKIKTNVIRIISNIINRLLGCITVSTGFINENKSSQMSSSEITCECTYRYA